MAFSFGATNPTTSAPAFGNPASTSTGFTGFFNQKPAATTAASTGFGFGTGTTGFGTNTGTTGFGTGTGTTGFGTGTTGFGTGTTGFGTGTTGFGTGTTGFGTGTGTTGFGTGTGTTGFGTGTGTTGFGTGTGTTGFGIGTGTTGFGTGTTGFGTGTGTTGFGTGTTGFGTGTGTTGFGTGTTGFGTGTGTFGTGTTGFGTQGSTGLFGTQQQQQQQQQQQAVNTLERIGTAVTLPVIYGDERDAIIAKWNQLQAYWGTGKGYFSQNGFVEFTPDNPYCRFKAIGYNKLPKMRNEDGLVALTIKEKEENVTRNQQAAVDKLFEILGKKPEFSVCVEGIKTLPDDKTELVFYILERPATGPARRIPASDAFNYFTQPHIKTQLQVIAESITPKTGFTSEQLKHYLENPPSGIDPLLWQQAKLDNPDPENFIPVPMIGFKALNQRTKHQEQQTKAHQQRLDMIAQELTQLQHKHSNMLAKLEEYKRKHIELAHKFLQVITKQEIFRKMGFAIQVEEEQLRVHLEKIQAELNHPTQFKGRLNELMSHIRMQNHLGASRNDFNYQMDPSLQQEIRQLLNEQQEGLKHLISIVKDDSQDIKLMEQNLTDSSINRR